MKKPSKEERIKINKKADEVITAYIVKAYDEGEDPSTNDVIHACIGTGVPVCYLVTSLKRLEKHGRLDVEWKDGEKHYYPIDRTSEFD